MVAALQDPVTDIMRDARERGITPDQFLAEIQAGKYDDLLAGKPQDVGTMQGLKADISRGAAAADLGWATLKAVAGYDTIDDIVLANKTLRSLPRSEGSRELAEAEGAADVLGTILRHPIEAGIGPGLESLRSQIEAMFQVGAAAAPVGAGAGFLLGGPAGAATGALATTTGAASALTSYASEVQSLLAEKGVNVEDPAALRVAYQDEGLMAEVRTRAGAYAGVVGVIDALSAGVAGKALSGAKQGLLATAKAGLKETGKQAALGAAGEAGGQVAGALAGGVPVAVSGAEVAREAAGEFFGGGAPEVAIGAVTRRPGAAPVQATPTEAQAAPATPVTPEPAPQPIVQPEPSQEAAPEREVPRGTLRAMSRGELQRELRLNLEAEDKAAREVLTSKAGLGMDPRLVRRYQELRQIARTRGIEAPRAAEQLRAIDERIMQAAERSPLRRSTHPLVELHTLPAERRFRTQDLADALRARIEENEARQGRLEARRQGERVQEPGAFTEQVEALWARVGEKPVYEPARPERFQANKPLGSKGESKKNVRLAGKRAGSGTPELDARASSAPEPYAEDQSATQRRVAEKIVEAKSKPPDAPTPPTVEAVEEEMEGSFGLPDETALQWAERKIVDRFSRGRVVEKALGPLPESQRVTEFETLRPGQTHDARERFSRRFADPIIKTVQEKKLDPEAVGKFLAAYHEVDVQKRPRWKGKTRTAIEDPQGIVDAALKGPNAEDYQAILDRVKSLNAWKLDRLEEAGFLTKEGRAKWVEDYGDFYVPQKEIQDPEERFGVIGKGVSGKSKISERAEGRVTEAANPLYQSLAMGMYVIDRTARNRSARALKALVEGNPGGPWRKLKVSRTEAGKPNIELEGADPNNVVYGYENGDLFGIEVQDDLYARALKNLDSEKSHKVVQYTRLATNFYKLLQTRWSPDFLVTNPFRDLGAALASVGVEFSAKDARAVAKNVFPAMRGALKAEVKDSQGYWEDRYRALGENGGRISWVDSKGFDEWRKTMETAMKEGNAGRAVRSLNRYVSHVSNALENGTRVAVFDALVKKGMSERQAALYTLNLANFYRRGEWGPALGLLYLFANPTIQQTRKMATLLSTPRGRARFAAAGGGMIATGYLAAAMMRAASDEDDWEKFSDWEKETSLFVPNPLDPKHPLKIPLAYGYSSLFSLGLHLEAMVAGDETPEEAALGAGAHLAQSLNPLGTAPTQGGALHAAIHLGSPWFFDPIAQLGLNESAFGSPIQPEQREGLPDAHAAWRNTPDAYKDFAAWIGAMSGGTEAEPGAIDFSPETMEHWVQFLGGGAGRSAQRMATTVGTILKGEAPLVPDIPVVRRFVSEPDALYDTRVFSENAKAVEVASNRLSALKQSDPKAALRYRQAHPELSLAPMLRGLRERIGVALDNENDEEANKWRRLFNKRFEDAVQREGS